MPPFFDGRPRGVAPLRVRWFHIVYFFPTGSVLVGFSNPTVKTVGSRIDSHVLIFLPVLVGFSNPTVKNNQ